jgi:predicted O-methyltransferase YrrM
VLNSIHYLLYVLGAQDPVTQTTEEEREVLRSHAAGKKRLVEIGVFHGVNTRVFREVMASDAVLFAIDPFPRFFFGMRGLGWARRIAHREVSKCRNGRVVWVETTGHAAINDVRIQPYLPVDFVFIDGDHSWEGIKGDWESWREHIMPGGIVCLHDTQNRPGSGSERYMKEIISVDPAFKLIASVCSLSVLRRKPLGDL